MGSNSKLSGAGTQGELLVSPKVRIGSQMLRCGASEPLTKISYIVYAKQEPPMKPRGHELATAAHERRVAQAEKEPFHPGIHLGTTYFEHAYVVFKYNVIHMIDGPILMRACSGRWCIPSGRAVAKAP